MKYVLILLIGIVIGVVGGMYGYKYFFTKEKTSSNLVKVIVSVIVVIGLAIYAFTIDWRFAASFVAGVCVGLSPYLTTITKSKEDSNEQGA